MTDIKTLDDILNMFMTESTDGTVAMTWTSKELRAGIKQALNLYIEERERLARINSLLDLEQWIKLHDLQQDMILDGIEHMVKSNLQVPDQPRLDHTDRVKELER